MSLKFAANISTMFREGKRLPERYQMAKDYGFNSVECQFPYDVYENELSRAKEKASVKQVLINSHQGFGSQFGFGLSDCTLFADSINKTLLYAEALKVECVHVIAELRKPSISEEEMENIYIRNLRYATELLAQKNILCVIEPMCPKVKPNYFMDCFKKAVRCIEKINHPNLKLLLDVYHLQMLSGNLTHNITTYFPHIGHIQISQAPDRTEPNAIGEINYKYILKLLENLNYKGYIGLEYIPSGTTKDSLSWLNEYGYGQKNISQ